MIIVLIREMVGFAIALPTLRFTAIKLRNVYWNPNLQILIMSFKIKHFQI